MASDQNGAVFVSDDEDEPSSSDNDLDVLNVNDDVLNEELEDEELEEDEEEDINSLSLRPPPIAAVTSAATSSDSPAVPLAVPASSAMTVASVHAEDSDRKRQRVGEALVERKPPQFDESRRLFQRLWTDEDEIELLQGFFEYTARRGGSNSHHHDTALFYDQIKSKLQLDFNKNQLVEKLRRLKKKYRNVMNKINSGKDFTFKTAHDQATFEISQKIWSNSLVKGNGGVVDDNVLDDDEGNVNNVNLKDDWEERKTPNSKKRVRPKSGVKVDEKRVLDDGFLLNSRNNNGNVEKGAVGSGALREGNIVGLIEETVRSCLSPLVKELLSSKMGGGWGARGFGGLVMNAMPLNFGGVGGGEVVDEKWRKQQILELEVYSKRLELVQDQIKAALKELHSMGG